MLCRIVPWCVGLSVLIAVESMCAEDAQLTHRWVYLQTNLQVQENVGKAREIMQRAAAAGYNGVVLADFKLNVLHRVPEHYFANAKEFLRNAEELKLEVIPCVCPVGYSEGLLAHNPNLAEGLPVRDAPFVVRGKKAELVSELKNALPGGGFEEHKNQSASGWGFQDGPGKASFVDTQVRHGGKNSLRFENLKQNNPPSGNGRANRSVRVQPWRQHHAWVWIKTADFSPAGDVRMFAMSKDGHVLSHSYLNVKPTQDWTQHHIVFNSLDNKEVLFYCGAWGGEKGKLWLDDAGLEETALVNLLRRPGCPLVVKGEDRTIYEEGKDFAKLVDPKMGQVQWQGGFDVWHEPPTLEIPAGSRIRDGQKLLVSFYHAVTIHDNQVACCLAEPEVFAVLEDQIRRVEETFKPKTYFLSHDEIRCANWCAACQKEGRTAGQLLASNVKACAELVRKISPQTQLCIWSDMFDPHHNAATNANAKYYLVNGDLAGSWEGLPSDITIVNWNSGKAKQSLPFFGQRGHGQVLAGFYDGDPKSIRGWLDAGKGVSGVRGVMYTTWQGNFKHLETFAAAAWGK